MLQSVGLQRVRHDLETKQQQCIFDGNTPAVVEYFFNMSRQMAL